MSNYSLHADVFVSFLGRGAAAGSAFNEAQLEEVGLVHFFYRVFLFGECGGNGFEAHRATLVLFYDDGDDIAVYLIEARLIYLKERECLLDRFDIERFA